MVVVHFSCGPPLLLFGVMPLVVKDCLHCVGLQHFGEWEGLSEQRGLLKSGCLEWKAPL